MRGARCFSKGASPKADEVDRVITLAENLEKTILYTIRRAGESIPP
jgi:hypothetical protein